LAGGTIDGGVETSSVVVIQVVPRIGRHQLDFAAFGQVDRLVKN